MRRLIDTLYLVAGSEDHEDRVQSALYGLANAFEDALGDAEAKYGAAHGLLWGYGPGAWRVPS